MPIEYINVYTFVTGNSQKKMTNDYYLLKAEQNKKLVSNLVF